ncbi:hypothetical protein [Nocardiopsis ganjiahuensis]|uniref:hypothetical protein n=1 Tax=Nocardiopsis ganjiahuensis TaxID=239984 RepID=UPI00037CD59B|nr:hypothetical protein [Nocardiopsis ganjiahuensis]
MKITADHIRGLFDALATDIQGRNAPVLVLDDDGGGPCILPVGRPLGSEAPRDQRSPGPA